MGKNCGCFVYCVDVCGKALNGTISSNSLTRKGLLPDTEYSFRVQSVRGNEESEWSDFLRVRTEKASDFSECAWKRFPKNKR